MISSLELFLLLIIVLSYANGYTSRALGRRSCLVIDGIILLGMIAVLAVGDLGSEFAG